ncbi:MAG TPA: hypothetical protein VHO72_14910, partial [Bacteroidales bacterium]|nr:hypothetical protein [Bacteroidales bacterium]
MIKFTLFLVQLMRKPLEWLGADYDQLRLILHTKLTMDFRRVPSSLNTSGRSKQTFSKQLLIFSVLGIFISFGFFAIHDIL